MISKSQGQTRTERVLSDLCDRTFLKLWSYANPFKDDGKELCDLLAVFENHVFIFFDRESLKFFRSKKDQILIWERWKKEAIEKQIKTSIGAEKYIKNGRRLAFFGGDLLFCGGFGFGFFLRLDFAQAFFEGFHQFFFQQAGLHGNFFAPGQRR